MMDDEEVLLIDVRTPQEFKCDQMPGAVNIPFRSLSSVAETLDKAAPTCLVCRSGARSASAAVMMIASGFERLYILDGGTVAWWKRYGNE